MSRYIDTDALKEFIDDCGICDICPQKAPRCSDDCDFPECVTEKWNVAIDAQPHIDIVRCKECKHNPWDLDQLDYTCVWDDDFADREQTPDDFCSYGEREGE